MRINELYPWQSDDYTYLLQLRGRMPQAILLQGAKGIGVDSLALNWIISVLCPNSATANTYCGKCNSCLLFADDSHPDFYLLTAVADEKTISVSAVRAVIDFLALSTHISDYKVVLIKDTNLLSLSSANALLKILEEPPSYAIFVLLTDNLQQLLPTIVSRCHKYRLSVPNVEMAQHYLNDKQIEHGQFWLKFYDYSPLFETPIDNQHLQQFIDVLATPNVEKIYELTVEFDGKTIPYNFILEFIGKWLSDIVSYKLTNELIYFTDYISSIEALREKLNLDKAFFLQDKLNFLMQWVNHPLNYKLQIENLLFNYQQIFVK
ncbi:MAG: polymerase subunit delta [Pseudomonadota bacterium]|nr:polymerase subunit delta [Pseudomonadota bacterium]